MLFDPESHEQLLGEPWRPAAIEAAIREIVADTEAAFDDGWPAHPEDEPEPVRFRSAYAGGAGVIRALDELQRRGLCELQRDYVPYLEQDYVPDYPDDDHQRGLHFGEAGIRLVRQRIAPSSANADRLAVLIAQNARDEHRELMWGSAGTMLAAAELHHSTGEDRWAELWREGAGLARGRTRSGVRRLDAGDRRQAGAVPRPCARLRGVHACACRAWSIG